MNRNQPPNPTGLANWLPIFVRVPSLRFLMGTPENQLSTLAQRYGGTRESYRSESPQQRLTLPGFALARVPVTNGLYGCYVAASGARAPLAWRSNQPPAALEHVSVVDITWHDAATFCTWLTAALGDNGLPVRLIKGQPHDLAATETEPVTAPAVRLPTEAEWEHAARGTDGRPFPWGADFTPVRACTSETGQPRPMPVGSYPTGASPYGVLDMAGNVWEWTASLDAPYPYDPQDGREAATAEGRRIARGGCYANPQGFARCACRFRFAPTVRSPFLGFRLAFSHGVA